MESSTPILIKSFSLTPNRLSIYNTLVKPLREGDFVKERISVKEKNALLKNIYGEHFEMEKRFHNFQLSESAKKNMMSKINWLYFLAKSKFVKTYSGKEIYNFKINFLTLTLPAKQIHSTAEITNTCFNQFLTEIRERTKMENYVWRLEFQKNGNVHYHIVTDTYIDYFFCLKIWNRCVNKLGYVDTYTEKHKKMSINDYCAEYSNNGKVDFNILKQRYFKGKAQNWDSPNSVDVKSVTNGKKIAFYIAKYFSKGAKTGVNCNENDNKENSIGLRLWFCSRSLSRLKKITDFVPAFSIDLLALVSTAEDLFTAVHEYCTSFYFSFSRLADKAKAVIYKLLKDYSIKAGYIPAT